MQERVPLFTPARSGKDALLRAGNARLGLKGDSDVGRLTILRRTLVLTILPTSAFVVAVVIIGSLFHSKPGLASFLLGLLLAPTAAANLYLDRGTWQRWLGRFLVLAALLGVAVGAYAYCSCWVYYFSYLNLRKYTNVLASQNPAAFGDAAMLQFAAGSQVDVTRSVGFRSLAAGATFCVAPVIDPTMSSSDGVAFFAGGVNCCSARGSFDCDDSGVPGSRSGLLLLDPDRLVGPFVGDTAEREGFDAAIRLHAAVFQTPVAAGRRVLRWTRDPVALQDRYLRAGITLCGAWCGALSGLLLVVGAALTSGWSPRSLAAKFAAPAGHDASRLPRYGLSA